MDTVILTSYFSKKLHPQRGDPDIVGVDKDGRVKQEDFSYIKDWYESVNLLGLKARIFHDELSDEFVSKYTTQNIEFIKTDVEGTRYSNNDWRFFCYYDYLKTNKHDAVFMTDCSDVIIMKDPSLLLSDEDGDCQFFAGSDLAGMKWSDYRFASFPYEAIHKNCSWAGLDYFKKHGEELALINMGVIGSIQENVEFFLKLFTECRERARTTVNINMALGQFILRYAFQDSKVCVGEPLTSEYKKWQKDRKDVYFIHK